MPEQKIQKIRLDLNNPIFQKDWLALPKEEAERFRASLKQISQMSWEQIYKSKGLHWEEILSKTGPDGNKIYSIRITDKFRAVVYRDHDFMRFLTLHTDHDSVYH